MSLEIQPVQNTHCLDMSDFIHRGYARCGTTNTLDSELLNNKQARLMSLFQDQWIGDADKSKGPGHFGTWRWCTDRSVGDNVPCKEISLCFCLAKMAEKSVVVAWMILEPSSPRPSVLPQCSLAWPSSSAFSVLSPLSSSSCAGTTKHSMDHNLI